MSLVAALLSLLVACGSGQPPHRGDAGDGGGRDGATDRVTQPPADARDDGPVASADGAADARLRAHAHVAADAGDAGPRCTLGTAVNCAACGDPACTLANTLMACTSADQCGRAVCAAGFGNCKASSLDCETSFAAGGTCLPRYEGTTTFATDYTYTSSTAIGTDGSFFLAGQFRGTVDFDPTGAHDVHAAVSASDIAVFITKLNADGSYAWTQSFPESGVALGAMARTTKLSIWLN